MKNERNAGRKGRLTQAQVEELNSRWKAGESVAELAEECGISRQALYRRFQEAAYVPAQIDYSVEGELCTRIEVDFHKERLHIVNYVAELS
ncbi:MAG: Hin recombinase, partial [Lachnospiraceae bacterium]|nr:Hin recombinase [Lachnospiraceae bacterium]